MQVTTVQQHGGNAKPNGKTARASNARPYNVTTWLAVAPAARHRSSRIKKL